MQTVGPLPNYSPYTKKAQGYSDITTHLGPQNSKNPLWRHWGYPALFSGTLLIIVGLAMIPVEVTRIIRGSLNKGERSSYILYPNYNYDEIAANIGALKYSQSQSFLPDFFPVRPETTVNAKYRLDNKGVIPYSALSNFNINNFPIQDKYLWPWSHAALLFGILTIAAGGLGILSGTRSTYSSAFVFFVLCLCNSLLTIFLVVYYAIHVNWQLNHNGTLRTTNEASIIDYTLGVVMLALSCFNLLLSFLTTIYVGLALSICCGSKGYLEALQNKPIPTPMHRTLLVQPPALPTRPTEFVKIKLPTRYVPIPTKYTTTPQMPNSYYRNGTTVYKRS